MTTPIAERVAGQSAARAATPFRHRPVTRRRSRVHPQPPPSQSARRPVGAGSHLLFPESVPARSGPCGAGLPRARVRPPWECARWADGGIGAGAGNRLCTDLGSRFGGRSSLTSVPSAASYPRPRRGLSPVLRALPEWGSRVLLLQPGLPNDVAYWQLIRPADIVHVTGGAPGALMISIVPDRCTVMGSCPARRRTAAVSVGLSIEGG
jgi:hypothetical protein